MCPLLAQLIIGFFIFFLLQPFTVLMKQTRQSICAVKQSIFLDVYGPKSKGVEICAHCYLSGRWDIGNIVTFHQINVSKHIWGPGCYLTAETGDRFIPITNIQLDWIDFSRKNALAYLSGAWVTEKKSCATLTPGSNGIKLFAAVIYKFS